MHYQRSCLVWVKGCILDVGSILQSPNQLRVLIYSYLLDYKSRLNVYIHISRLPNIGTWIEGAGERDIYFA